MTIKISSKEFLRAKQLETLGIPLDHEVLEKRKEACHGLWMGQDPSIPQTILFDMVSGHTGVVIALKICNESEQMISLRAARLKIPWCNQICWLEDPFRNAPRKFIYSFPKPDLQGFERDLVLNHQFGQNSKLFLGDQLDGFLLGIGDEPIPDQFRDCEIFEASLSIFDSRNNPHSLNVKFLVTRDIKRCQRLKAPEKTAAMSYAERRSLSWVSAQVESCIGDPVTQSGKIVG
jgi:hypothetical protein